MDKEELRNTLIEVSKNIDPNKLGAFYTDKVIRKYTKQEQDMYLAHVCDTILNVDGGYWQIVENMNYMPEFEHYSFKSTLSYEKGNVPKTVAKRELTIKQYGNLYKENGGNSN